MSYTIIEDASPYYVRFTFDGIEQVVNYINNLGLPEQVTSNPGYSQYQFDVVTGDSIISMLKLPDHPHAKFKPDKVKIVLTPPGGGCGIHKDGQASKTSLNLMLMINDTNCYTDWYNEDDFADMPLLGDVTYSRSIYENIIDMNTRFNPTRTINFKANELVLLNTDIWHSWSNVDSKCVRKILSLKHIWQSGLPFDELKKIIFQS